MGPRSKFDSQIIQAMVLKKDSTFGEEEVHMTQWF